MAEQKLDEMLKKYLGVSAPRIIIGVIMLIFGLIIVVYPDLVAILIAIYLIISGILILIDELIKGQALKALKK
ncbi:MAG: DUF3096 domain-containing protein [Desulfurococcaceae archaeon]